MNPWLFSLILHDSAYLYHHTYMARNLVVGKYRDKEKHILPSSTPNHRSLLLWYFYCGDFVFEREWELKCECQSCRCTGATISWKSKSNFGIRISKNIRNEFCLNDTIQSTYSRSFHFNSISPGLIVYSSIAFMLFLLFWYVGHW